jgi:AcrR family transcriptional regulator
MQSNNQNSNTTDLINMMLSTSSSFGTVIDPLGTIGFPKREEMPAAKPNKHALRTKETREQLLRAAEVVFARDGYEAADLAEIAAMTGRTRGAIYAQFKSKEDVFLAIIQERTQRQRAEMEKVLAESKSTKQNLQAFREFCFSLIDDPVWTLLVLEFKLFAMRHPESKERLRKYYDEIFSKDQEKRLEELLGAAAQGNDALSRSVAVRSVSPLLSALVVEASFAPASMDKATVKKVATLVFDALMPATSK